MRVKNPTLATGGDSFNTFAHNDASNPAAPTEGVTAQRSERHLSLDDMRQYKPQRNKRIILSDDEDDPTDPGDASWLAPRNPMTISSSERQRNAATALKERNHTKTPSKKLKTALHTTDSVDSDNDALVLLDEDTPEAVRISKTAQIKIANKKERRPDGHRTLKSESDADVSADDDAGSDNSDDANSSDDDDDGDGWGGEKSKGDIQKEAQRILKACETFSSNLRRSLKLWNDGESKEPTLDEDVTEDGCLNITSIRAQPHELTDGMERVLTDRDIQDLCPGLQLKPYQLVGVNWLKLLHLNKINGVLADDMGLGKTVQSIAFLGWLRSYRASSSAIRRPHLIVVPASTLSNWENELQRFCPAFDVRTYHGSQKERAELRCTIKNAAEDGEVDVVLSTYTVFERETSKDDRRFLSSLNFEYLVLDEAHCIKNTQSSRYAHLNALRSKHRLLLSGTPVQNDVGELLALLSFLMPKTFNHSDCELLLEAFGWQKGASSQGQHQQGFSIKQLRSMLAPFVLRRLKRDVLDQLVEKETEVVRVRLDAAQRVIYEGVLLRHARMKQLHQRQAELAAAEEALIEGAMGKPKGVKGKLKKAATTAAAEAKEEEIFDLCSPDGATAAAAAAATAPVGNAEVKDEVGNSAREGTMETEVSGGDASLAPSTLAAGEAAERPSGVTAGAGAGAENGASVALEPLSASEAKHLFTALRKAANHPLLLRVRYQDPAVMDRIAMVAFTTEHFGNQCDLQRVREELDGFSDFDLHQICMEYPSYLSDLELPADALYDSPKLCVLKTMLPELQAQGHRMLVFSQWTRLLDLLEVFLNDVGMKFLRLDGSTPVKERQRLIDEFNAAASAADAGDDSVPPIPVFLLSTKAGGLGINLTSANVVILHDLDFNPENDRQAEDRCHRIGQTKAVKVFKLVAEDTVDEDIFEMGERKRKLSTAVLSDDRAQPPDSGAGSAKKGASASGRKGVASPVGGRRDSGDDPDLDGDIGAIGRILQKALQSAVKKV